MNGFTEKDMLQLEKIDCIELCLEDFPHMSSLSIFRNLKTLILINVGLTEIKVFLIYETNFKGIG